MSLIVLKTKLRRNILTYSFTHPNENYYVRELAVLINEDPGNLSRELRRLEQEGLYISQIRGGSKFYSLSKDYPLFEELKKIISKTEGAEGSLKSLLDEFKGIILGLIYGSYAKDKINKTSDIDLVVVGDLPKDQFTRKIRNLESKLNREINFTSYSPKDFDKKRKQKGGFLNLVLKGDIIVLKGRLNA